MPVFSTMANVFEASLPLIKRVRSSDGALQTQELLEVCRQILPVVGRSHKAALI